MTLFDNGQKVYIATIKDGLTEIEANDLENQLIIADKRGKSE